MTVVCKVKDRIVDLETWVNNAEFDDKVNRVNYPHLTPLAFEVEASIK